MNLAQSTSVGLKASAIAWSRTGGPKASIEGKLLTWTKTGRLKVSHYRRRQCGFCIGRVS